MMMMVVVVVLCVYGILFKFYSDISDGKTGSIYKTLSLHVLGDEPA